eukprot:CAMPEP_0117503130 /NCGR_PEP_ID=MMETSP0784-20121206/24168_1 /TAXON_ID=39447 /ORGANISM="" /LENGTH=459 /DNA_ID=CAMNT_0005298431 /DNA_START=65 /DNA_END=1444 /DNA_ORIENTATION=+
MRFMTSACLVHMFFATHAHSSDPGWEAAPYMANPPSSPEKHHCQGFVIGGTAYLATGNERIPEFDHCGECATRESFTDAYFSYNPQTGWKDLGPHPGGPRGYGISAVMDPGTDHEMVYFGFGQTRYPDPNNPGSFLKTPRWGFDADGNYTLANRSTYPRLNDFWSFNGIEWKRLADFPGTARTHPGMVAVNGKVYVGLGFGELCPTTDPCEPHSGLDDVRGKSGNLKDVWEYDVATNTWSEIPEPFPYRAHHPFFFASGTSPFFLGGHAGGYIYHETYTLDGARRWKEVMDIPNGRGRVAGTQFNYGGRGYVLCGETAVGEDTVMDGWSNVVGIDDYNSTVPKEHHRAMDTCEFWEYDAAKDAWAEMPVPPGKSRWTPTSFVLDGYVYLLDGVTRSGQRGDAFSQVWPQQGYRYKLKSHGDEKTDAVVNGSMSSRIKSVLLSSVAFLSVLWVVAAVLDR